MPYFIQRQGDKHCVVKGVKGQEGNETVKCHDDPASAKKHLAALMVNVEDAKAIDKAELSSESRGNLPDSAFLYIQPGGKKDKSGRTTPRSLRHLPYRHADGSIDKSHLQNAISRLSQKATGKDWLTPALREQLLARARKLLKSSGGKGDSEGKSIVPIEKRSDHVGPRPNDNKFISYKSGDDWRWLAISSTAVEDREYETVSEKAYDDAIQYADTHGYGDLDLIHVDGTEIGNCDLMFRMGQSLLEGGRWHDSDLAQKVRTVIQSNPDKWGVSIKFQYDPELFDGSTYHGGIRILKRSILPRQMAASLGTAIVVQGGKMKQIDEETKAALMELGVSEEKVMELAQRQKSLPEEVNTKEKETEITESNDTSIVAKIKSLLGITPETAKPDAEEQSETDTEVEREKVQETEVEKEEIEKEVESKIEVEVPEIVLTDEAMKAISLKTAQVITPAIAKALGPIAEQVKALTEWKAEWGENVQKRLVEVEKDVETKVAEKIDSLPPIVKVRTTELKQAETTEQPNVPALSTPNTRNAEFVKSVSDIVTQALGAHFGSGEFKL